MIRPAGNSRWWPIVVLGLALVVLIWRLASGESPMTANVAGVRSALPRLRAAPSWAAAAPTPAAAPSEGAPSAPSLPDESGPGAEYMRIYQGQSGRLANGERFADRHGPRPVSLPGVPITIWATKNELDPGDKATLQARPSDASTVIEEAVAELRVGNAVKRIPMTADAAGGYGLEITSDLMPVPTTPAGDGDPDTAPPVLVDAIVEAKVRRAGQTSMARLVTLVAVQDSGAAFVPGSEQIRLTDDGNAALFLDVEVKRAAPYHAYAELWSQKANRSLAFGRKNLGVLPPGRHRIALLFGGKIIRASGADGPYAVRNVELLRVTRQMPHTAAPLAELMVTPAWHATDFR